MEEEAGDDLGVDSVTVLICLTSRVPPAMNRRLFACVLLLLLLLLLLFEWPPWLTMSGVMGVAGDSARPTAAAPWSRSADGVKDECRAATRAVLDGAAGYAGFFDIVPVADGGAGIVAWIGVRAPRAPAPCAMGGGVQLASIVAVTAPGISTSRGAARDSYARCMARRARDAVVPLPAPNMKRRGPPSSMRVTGLMRRSEGL